MKTIKINYCDFWGSFNKEDNLFSNILKKHFIVEISDKPDFLICSNRFGGGIPFACADTDCVRIQYMGENVSPDFTLFDYVIGFDFLEFGDRYFRLPHAFFFNDGHPWIPESLTREGAERILQNKTYFCNFIYHHQSAHGIRELLFKRLNEYKPVVSPGNLFNNVGSKTGIGWKEKFEYLRLSKFTIACDSINYPGFVTEKIIQPFQSHSIPIYFGSSRIADDFNPLSFIECHDERDIDSCIQRIIELDNNDEKYLQMLMECPLYGQDYLSKKYTELEQFLVNIFNQEPHAAQRRIKHFCADTITHSMKRYNHMMKKIPSSIRRFIK